MLAALLSLLTTVLYSSLTSGFSNLIPTVKRNNKLHLLNLSDGGDNQSEENAVSAATRQSQYGVTTDPIESYVKCGKCKYFFYLAPEDLGTGGGKRLECSLCGHSWFQSVDRIANVKPGFELSPLTDSDLNRIKENVAAGKSYDFVGDGKLYVGNLNFNVHEDDLISAFSEYGEVGDAFIVQGEGGRSKGFAFVTMRTKGDMKKIMETLDGEELFGRRLQIREANN